MRMPEGPVLYGRDPLLRSLVPRLTGLKYDERSRAVREHHKDLPVVLVTGQHGTGRSAVLEGLAEHYRGRLPLAHVRATVPGCAAAAAAAAAGGSTVSCASSVVGVLEKLVCGLAPALSRRFPLLLPGLFAVSSWRFGDGEERDAACRRYARLLLACRLASGDEKDVRSRWATDVESGLKATEAARDPHVVAAAVLREYARRYHFAPAQQWYGNRYPEDLGGQDPLLRLSQWFHRGGDYRHATEQTLMSAFLHDLAGAYGLVQRWNREPRPLALLDDAHSPAGRRFLDLLLEHRALPEYAGRDQLVVVATQLGDAREDAADAVCRELPDLVTSSGWVRKGHSPSAGLLLVPLPPLGRDDILPLLDRAATPLHPYLASALHSLTGGHPAASTMLCDAVLHAAGRGSAVAPRDLLDLCTGDGRPVTEALLERLVPERRQRDRLVLLCLARDSTAAEALAAYLRLEGPEQLPANTAADYLEEQQWQPLTPADRPLVADALLQTLLVHEARRTSAAAGAHHNWQEIHRFLRVHHTQRGEAGEADALRHTLAAGEAETVVATLAEEFQSEQGEQSAEHWLTCLSYSATAPAPPVGDWTDERVQVALGAHDARYAHLHETERCVNRLLHALWYLSEPHTEPDSEPDAEMCQAIGDELGYLSLRHPSWHAVLGQAARTWPAAARKKRPFPIPRQ